jgi:general secretion pathway protein G
MKRIGLALILLIIVGALLWFGMVRPFRTHEEQRTIAEMTVTRGFRTALTAFRVQVGRYPTTEEGLRALLIAPEAIAERWHGPYVEGAIPLDPWGRAYHYRAPGQKNVGGYDVWSDGPDASREEDDIGNWPRG